MRKKNRKIKENLLFYFILFYFISFYFIFFYFSFYFIEVKIMDPRKRMLIDKKNERAKIVLSKFFYVLERNRTTKKEVAEELGISRALMTMMSKGQKFPSQELLDKIELYIEQHPITLPPLYDIIDALRKYLNESGKTLEVVADELGTSHENLTRWLSGEVIPGREYMEKLSELLYI